MFETAKRKLERATKHIADAETALIGFDARAYRVTCDKRYGSWPWAVVMDEQLPSDLLLAVGDAVHNLRSALDHLAWELAAPLRYDLDKGQLRRLDFPVGRDSEDQFLGAIEKQKGFSEQAKSFLRALAVFPNGCGKAIVALHELDIDDKHRDIIDLTARCTVHGFQRPRHNHVPTEWIDEKPITIEIRIDRHRVHNSHFGSHFAGGLLLYSEPGGLNYVSRKEGASFETWLMFARHVPYDDVDIIASLHRLHDHISKIVVIADEQKLGVDWQGPPD